MKKKSAGGHGKKKKGSSWGSAKEAMADRDLQKLVKDETAFGKHLKRIAEHHGLSRLEIGRLIHFYKQEHGHRYGDGLNQRIADMASISVRSVYNYERLYRMTVEVGDNANLQNLSPSTLFELSRLLDKPDGCESILEMAESAVLNSYTTSMVASLIRESLRVKPIKSADKKNDMEAQTQTKDAFSSADEVALSNAVAVLAKCSSVEFDPASIRDMAEHRQRLQQIAVGILDHVAAILDREPAQYEAFETSLLSIRNRCEELMAKGNPKSKEAA